MKEDKFHTHQTESTLVLPFLDSGRENSILTSFSNNLVTVLWYNLKKLLLGLPYMKTGLLVIRLTTTFLLSLKVNGL
jgi:hypothetical protein